MLRLRSRFASWATTRSVVTLSDSPDSVAVIDDKGSFTYADIHRSSRKVAVNLQSHLNERHKQISFLCQNNADYAVTKYGIWKSGNISVPLYKSHPAATMEYYVKDSKSSLLIASREFKEKAEIVAKNCGANLIMLDDIVKTGGDDDGVKLESPEWDDECMIIYTSGTTGPPKGVVHTHKSLRTSIDGMISAWGWTRSDRILHLLPLHHVHGIFNCLLTPLTVGATVRMIDDFDPARVWSLMLDPKEKINFFMAVPTVFAKLIQYYTKNYTDSNEQEKIRRYLSDRFRVMISGSAALPVPVLERWKQITGHTILERYGMTEIGMTLTNPLNPPSARRAGWVGRLFPKVNARIINEDNEVVAFASDSHFEGGGKSGHLQVQGPNLFKEYFGRAEATAKEFTEDRRWFKTGDSAVMDEKTGEFKILGRTSVDIIKSGGYKISALDIERVLLEHENVQEVAVLGIEDEVYGQIVGAVVVPKSGQDFTMEDLRVWCSGRLPSYQIPRQLKVMPAALPKNNMGKVNKKSLVKEAFPTSAAS